MWNRVISWLDRNDQENTENQKLRELYNQNQYDLYIPNAELKSIHDRIRHCLDEDDITDYQGIDDTLKLMRDETAKWYQPIDILSEQINDPIYDDFNKLSIDKDFGDNNISNNNESDELLSYCTRLERNNAYLLQLVEKFEQVSFKKRYAELVLTNDNLQKEYNRLKSTNSKVYNSYCDLLEEIKKVKLENQSLKKKINHSLDFDRSKDKEIENLNTQIKKLNLENGSNQEKLKGLRKSNINLQKQISLKEDELIKMKGTNIATKLKLERAENMLLKIESADQVELKPTNKNNTDHFDLPSESKEPKEESFNIDSDDEVDDTIAFLQQKYKSNVPVI
jgi:hypothetical protein